MKKIVIIPNANKDKNLLVTREVVSFLTSRKSSPCLSDVYSNCNIEGATYLSENLLYNDCNFAITIGGDGTILSIADVLSQKNIPVIGINLGRVGFMAELETDEIGLLDDVLGERYSLDERMMLDISVIRQGNKIYSYRALNDIVVSNGSVSKMAELELYCSDTFVSMFHSDGVIVSTPTGSTAYSLSAGGAIIDPSIDCLLFTPVCPHSFSNARPIIFSPRSLLKIRNVQQSDDNTYLTVDGKLNVKLLYLDEVESTPSSTSLKLIKIKNNKFYDRVYQKLSERK